MALARRRPLEGRARSAPPDGQGRDLGLPFKTEEWLLSEVLSDAGETVVVEPVDLRRMVAARAKELAAELGVSRTRKKAVGRA